MMIIIVKEIEYPQKIKETTTKTRHKNIFRISFLTIFFLCLLHTATGEEMLLWEESIHNWKSDIIWSEEQGKRIEASREVWGMWYYNVYTSILLVDQSWRYI